MKKVIAFILLALCFTFLLVGCNFTDDIDYKIVTDTTLAQTSDGVTTEPVQTSNDVTTEPVQTSNDVTTVPSDDSNWTKPY